MRFRSFVIVLAAFLLGFLASAAYADFAKADGEIDIITRLVGGPGALGLCGLMIWLFAKHMQRAEARQVNRDKEISKVLADKDADIRSLVQDQLRMNRACTEAITESTELDRQLVYEFKHRPCLLNSHAGRHLPRTNPDEPEAAAQKGP